MFDRTRLVLAAGLILPASMASAAITYVDATMLNTDIASGGADSLWADGNDGTTGGAAADGAANDDGKWRYRGGFGGNGIWEATGSGSQDEDAVEIVTTATGLANGTYNVYVFFVPVSAGGGTGAEYPIRAGLSSNPSNNQLFAQFVTSDVTGATLGVELADTSFVTPPPSGGTRPFLSGLLLDEAVVTDGTLSVYIDDLPAQDTGFSDLRTWYAGIGYEVVPEPGSLALLGLGGLLLASRRRRG